MREPMPNWAGALLRIALAAAIAWMLVGFARWLGFPWYAGIVFAAVPIAAILAKPILEAAGGLIDWLRHAPHEPWQGRYYRFNDVHIRIHEVDGDLWFVDRDVCQACGLPFDASFGARFPASQHERIEGTRQWGFSEAGLEAFLSPSREAEAGKFLLWAKREVLAPHRRKRENAARLSGK